MSVSPVLPPPSGTVEDTELVEGLVLDQKASHLAGGVTRVEKAKIGLIQFCISPPKTDVSSLVCLHAHVLMLETCVCAWTVVRIVSGRCSCGPDVGYAVTSVTQLFIHVQYVYVHVHVYVHVYMYMPVSKGTCIEHICDHFDHHFCNAI